MIVVALIGLANNMWCRWFSDSVLYMFDRVETGNIDLTLSSRQSVMKLIPTYDGYDEWYSTGQSYRDTEDDSKKKRFFAIHLHKFIVQTINLTPKLGWSISFPANIYSPALHGKTTRDYMPRWTGGVQTFLWIKDDEEWHYMPWKSFINRFYSASAKRNKTFYSSLPNNKYHFLFCGIE